MGAALQTAGAAELAAELTCCACSSVCGLIARNAATRAKFRYWSLLLMATVTCIVLLIPGLRQKVYKIPNFCDKVVSPDTCDKLIGFSAVYRILLSLTVFHVVLAILTIRVDRVKSCRARFNNGLWMFKMGLIMGITFGSFYIPKQTGFFRIWMYISLTGGFMFAMFQIILVIDFGHSWSLSWAAKLETGYTKLWYVAMSLVTIVLFGMSFAAAVAFYFFFTHPPDIMKCHANVFYIAFITIQCFVASVVSITPTVQRELAGAGLLQSSVVILYTMYLTFNTLIAEPDSLCNPLGSLIVEYDSFTGVSGQTIFGCMVTLALLIFAFTVRTNTSHLGKYGLALAESEEFAMSQYLEDKHKGNVEKELETGGKEILLDEYVGYNYSFFHLIMSLASLHILMVITNWHSPDENSNLKKLVKNWASVWVQMASSFVSILVYIWFLVTPLVKKVWGPLFGINIPGKNPRDPNNRQRRKAEIIKASKIEPRDNKDSECIDDGPNQMQKINTVDMQPARHVVSSNQEPVALATERKELNQTREAMDIRTRRSGPVETTEQANNKYRGVARRNSFIALPSLDRSASVLSRTSKRQQAVDPRTRALQALERSNSVLSRASARLEIDAKLRGPQRLEDSGSMFSQTRPEIDSKMVRSSYKDNELKNRRNDKRRKDNEVMYSSNNSLVSSISNFITRNKTSDSRRPNRKVPKHRKSRQEDLLYKKRKRFPSSEIEQSHAKENTSVLHNKYAAQNQDDIQSGLEEKETETFPKQRPLDAESDIKQKLLGADSAIKQRIKDYNESVQALQNISQTNPNDSLVPSTFSKKAQDPSVAKEILKLQWKILRSQAKMVKIQERIIRLQAEAEAENEITAYKNAHEGNENRTRKKVYRHKELG